MTSGTATRRRKEREQVLAEIQSAQRSTDRRRQLIRRALWTVALLVIVTLTAAALISAQPVQDEESRPAPDFTLPASDGTTVSLADLRGKPIVLYFNEGAGCDSCIVQMAEIEKEPGFAAAGITVLPIVMNSAAHINFERQRFEIAAPFLLDDGTISEAYGTLGTGMHEGLPGHGFVLIDAEGVQRWYGNYPSMWLAPKELLEIVTDRL